VPVKEFRKLVNFEEVVTKNDGFLFWTTLYITPHSVLLLFQLHKLCYVGKLRQK